MEELLFTANIVLPLFFLILIGAFCVKRKIVNEQFVAGGNKLSFQLLLPVMLFNSVYSGRNASSFDPTFAVLLAGMIIVVVALLWITLRFFYKDTTKLAVMIQAGFRANFVLFGTYLMQSLYGDAGVTFVSSYLAIVVGMFNIFATIVLEFYNPAGAKQGVLHMIKKLFQNPLIIASITAIAFVAIGIEIPYMIEKTISNIASISTIFAMICLGGNLKLEKLKGDSFNIMVGTMLRLVIVPLFACGTFYLLGYTAEYFATALIVFATPVAVSSYIMAQQQGADGELAGGIVASSTLFATLSLFVFIYVAKVIGVF